MDNIIASAEITVTDVKDGVGISSVVTHFLATPLKKGITTATDGWDTEPQTMDDTNKYLWSYETIVYTDGYSQDSTPVIIGIYGEEGVGISDIVEYYLVSNKDTGIEVTDSRFDVKIPTMDETNRYLWKYEEIIYTNNERKNTKPVIVGVFGSKGTSVKNIENYYLATSASSGVTRDTDGFDTSMQPLTLTNKYLWNYEVIEYENPKSFSYTNPVIIGVHGEDGKDGTDAKLLYLTSTLETMAFDADGAATPSSQTATIEAKLQNISGSVSFSAKAYNGTSALSNSIALGGSGNSRTFSVDSFPSNATHVSITATLGNLTDTISIFKLRHGKEGVGGAPGENAIVGYLTNESITLGANSSGRVGSFTPATGTFRMFDGTTEVTESGTSYSLENSDGLAASIDKSTGVYKITAMNSDTATAEFKATYKDVSIFKTVTLSKSIAGEKGESGISYKIGLENAVIKRDSKTGDFAPKSFPIKGYKGTGDFEQLEDGYGFFAIYEQPAVVGATNSPYALQYTSTEPETKLTYTIRTNAANIRIDWFKDKSLTILLDQQTIPIITDWQPSLNETNEKVEENNTRLSTFREATERQIDIRLGMKMGYSSFTQRKENSIYLSGLKLNENTFREELVDTPGSVYLRDTRQTYTIPNQSLSLIGAPMNTVIYITWDNTDSELFLMYYETIYSEDRIESNRWLTLAGSTVVFDDSIFVLGELKVI